MQSAVLTGITRALVENRSIDMRTSTQGDVTLSPLVGWRQYRQGEDKLYRHGSKEPTATVPVPRSLKERVSSSQEQQASALCFSEGEMQGSIEGIDLRAVPQ